MSKNKFAREIEREIVRINEIIDFKILHGIAYKEETRLHRKLLNQISGMRRQKRSFNLFGIMF